MSSHSFSWTVENCTTAGCIHGSSNLDQVRISVNNVNFTSGYYSYKFKVSVLIVDRLTGLSAQTSLWLQAEPLPSAGVLSISPAEGISWATNFTIKAMGFASASGKVYYEFFCVKPDTGALIPISARTEAYSIVTPLPPGLESEDFDMTVMVKAYNTRGGYIKVVARFRCEPPISEASTVVEKYNGLKSSGDVHNPIDMLRWALMGSLLLSDLNESVVATAQSGELVCNGHGVMSNGNCICNLDYSKRANCTISDTDFALETQLAATLLSDTASLLNLEPSAQKHSVAFYTLLNIVNKQDLLNSTTRSLARNLLIICTEETSESVTDLARAIDGVSSMSNAKEYEQLHTLITRLVGRQLDSLWRASGDEIATTTTASFRTRSALIQGSLNVTINMGSVVFPSSLSMLNDTDEYVHLFITEWYVPVYAWINEYSRAKSGVVSIEMRTEKGEVKSVNDLQMPINISFPLEAATLSAQDLNEMRCLFYNRSEDTYSTSGMRFVSVDLEKALGTCQAYHLTDFVMGVPTGGAYVLPGAQTEETTIFGVRLRFSDLHKSPIFWLTISLTLICGYLCLWAYCKEKSENELAGMMRSKAYIEQKDLFREQTGIEPGESVVIQQSSFVHQQSCSGTVAAQSVDPRFVSSVEAMNPVQQPPDDPPKPPVDPANQVDTFRQEDTNPKLEQSPPLEDEGKKDAFDTIAIPVPGAGLSGAGYKQRQFRRKRKFKKKPGDGNENENDDEKVEEIEIPPGTEFEEPAAADLGQIAVDASGQSLPKSLAPEESQDKTLGITDILMVIYRE